ncbi:xanthine/CO dehydrogenase XdhC/CoxF family maturation factor [Pedobacter sp. CAN_A7]|uniref:XdhC family protein n=1 Tax=Pedobacter sp. CAN_A7 TaxID=2787722 RepID=UPI0018CA2CB7
MKEIQEIIKAFEHAQQSGQKSALATVVQVDGSSYRRAGARMLVTEDGQLTGAISGGCLEGDALKKALLAIFQQENKLVTYDTTDEDDLKFGVQLGCNGIVHILFEPINAESPFHPIDFLKQLASERQNAILVTLFSISGQQQPGTALLLRDTLESTLAVEQQDQLLPILEKSLQGKRTGVETGVLNDPSLNALVEFIPPAVSLVIAGAGNDAQPVVNMASLLGWQLTIVDGRPTHAVQSRFPKADHVLLLKPEQVLAQVPVDEQTVFILMTHNYNYDLALLKLLQQQETPYIGILGPKSKLNKMFTELQAQGINWTSEELEKVYSPLGLDIGAETSEEIALSMLAEIKAVLSGTTGASLRYKTTSIHSKPPDAGKETLPLNK